MKTCDCGKPAEKIRKERRCGVDDKGKLITFTVVLYLCDLCACGFDENAMEARYS